MDLSLLTPLEFYFKEGREEHRGHCKEFFDGLEKRSGVNRAENLRTAALYREKDAESKQLGRKLATAKGWRIALIVFSVLAFLGALMLWYLVEGTAGVLLSVGSGIVGVALLLLIFLWLGKRIRHFDEKYTAACAEAQLLLDKARAQIQPLLDLFNDSDTLTLLEKTMPEIKLDKSFNPDRLLQLERLYDFGEGFIDGDSSAIDTLSGTFSENPFVFQRYLYHYMGQKTYRGSLVIRWTETYRGSDGKVRRRTRTQTLHASVTKPFPKYGLRTVLSYGNQAAPDLSFSRKGNYINERDDEDIEREIEKGEKRLAKKARKAIAKGQSFTEMTNSEFDVLFGATDRDHEQQFRVLFTPLAQTNMVDLIRCDDGYGDDFAFNKSKRINHICSNHAQKWNMSTSPSNYYSYDIEICEKLFIEYNAEYFKSVFFDFLPLLSIPAYQHAPVPSMQTVEDRSAFTEREYEVIANRLGARNFAHRDAVTESILKTTCEGSYPDYDRVAVTAHSFGSVRRTDFVSVLGGDGRFHAVPVHWDDYYPVSHTSRINVRRTDLTPTEYMRSKDYDERTAVFGGLMGTLDALVNE